MSSPSVAVIVDLVNSRLIGDRKAAQGAILGGFARVDAAVPHVQALQATTADEFQAVYTSVADALEATLLARLSLPDGLDCRFGLGVGDVVTVGPGAMGNIQDGSGWWLARAAIDEAHRRENGKTPSSRSWLRADGSDPHLEPLVNAYLLSRDHMVGAMTERSRRLTFGLLLGRLQGELAEAEGVTQSAVSQALRRSGGATLAASIDELRKALA
jgi:hypothetical protein